MTTVRQVYEAMQAIAPLELAEHWDNPGLLVGEKRAICHSKPVHRKGRVVPNRPACFPAGRFLPVCGFVLADRFRSHRCMFRRRRISCFG